MDEQDKQPKSRLTRVHDSLKPMSQNRDMGHPILRQ